jgi:uncharacterized protein DUF1592/uncharacterized protein DUF1588/uncharacterized protein DUF1587/uncharacterized protein DUF1585/uncharacterized protein DUF1595
MRRGRIVPLLVVGAVLGMGYRLVITLSAADLQGRPPQSLTIASQPSSSIAPSDSGHRALLDQYCTRCHNERLKTAGLMLDTLNLDRLSEAPDVWEKVVRKLRTQAMPPAGLPRPDKRTYDTFATWLETELDRAAATTPNPGRPVVHRLNRAEYTNAIRDLLGLDVDGRTLLPADDSAYGFDNVADVLSVSPVLLDRYLSAARKIARLGVGDPLIRPSVETYTVSKYLVQDDRMSEDLPFGSRGGIAIRHNFPLDGEYILRIRLQRTLVEAVRGLAEPQQLDVRLDHTRIKLFTVGGGGPRAAYTGGGSVSSEYERTADAGLEVRFSAKAGMRLVGVAFLKNSAVPDGVRRAPLALSSFGFYIERDTPMAVASVQISGPYGAKTPEDTPSRRRIFLCRPTSDTNEEACAKTILSTLARRAYRRPTSEADVEKLVTFYKGARIERGFEAGIESALESLLIDPDFLFRTERDPANVAPGTAYRLSDLELASRLSFFLWSSIPDDELLDVAARGQLNDAAVLERQVRRMLADPRSAALVSNFSGQWLYLRNMRRVAPDPEAFPGFDDNLREALQRETELFVESTIRDDRSVVDLLTANYTFVNERLARHYGIPNIYGSHFRRVTFNDDTRGGLLGQGSILMVTSYPARTSPVLRGKWLLENILGAPPPPPPGNVPPLSENGEGGGKPLSMRERMEQHRKDPVCASCHARMDPLGFALENFDAIGRWRATSEAGTPIDASGVLPDGTKFNGPSDLRKALVSRRVEFVTTVTEKLLTYALGRGVESYDRPAIRTIMRGAASHEYRWSSLVWGIVKSVPFQMRRSQESGPPGRPTGNISGSGK